MTDYSVSKDHYYMRNALDLSERGLGNTYPNPSIGVVIVKNDKIISRGWTQPGGRPHAESIALNKNKKIFKGATLYSTFEPCSHFGKTPPCVDQIIKSKIKRVVIALKDPNPKVNGRGIIKLKKNKIKVTLGVLKKETKKANLGFFYKIQKNRPFIATKLAITRNNKMINQKNKWITSESSRKFAHFLRGKYDAIITGINTVLSDNPLLNCRLPGMEKFSPIRIILDSKLRIKENLKIVQSSKKIPTYIFTNSVNEKRIKELEKYGIRIKIINSYKKDRINLNESIKEIAKIGVNSAILESGPSLNVAFFNKNLINKVYYFESKKVLISSEISLKNRLKIKKFEDLKYKLLSKKIINNDILKIYQK